MSVLVSSLVTWGEEYIDQAGVGCVNEVRRYEEVSTV